MFYGWGIVALAFLTHFLIAGTTFYSFGVLLIPLAEEFGGGRLGVTLLPVAMIVGSGLISPPLGRFLARGPIRETMVVGCLVTGVGFLLASHATALWQIGLVFGTALALGMQTLGGVASHALVVNWFSRGRAMALGLSLMGVSVSGVVMAHAATWLVQSGGWRLAFEAFGWTILCVAPLVWWVAVDRPQLRNLLPDGDVPDDLAADSATQSPRIVSTREGLRERNLWVVAAVSGLAFMSGSAILTHSVAFATDAGFSAERGAWLLSVLAGGATAGKVVFGWLCDRVGPRMAFLISLTVQLFGSLGFVVTNSYWMLLAVGALLGLGFGGILPLAAATLARAFGPASFAPMMGLMTPMLIPFQAVGTPFAAWVVDTTGSYRGALLSFGGVFVLAALLLSRLRVDSEGVPHEGPELSAARS